MIYANDGILGSDLICLSLLMRLNRKWKVIKAAASYKSHFLLLIALACSVLWLFVTGEWTFSAALTEAHLVWLLDGNTLVYHCCLLLL